MCNRRKLLRGAITASQTQTEDEYRPREKGVANFASGKTQREGDSCPGWHGGIGERGSSNAVAVGDAWSAVRCGCACSNPAIRCWCGSCHTKYTDDEPGLRFFALQHRSCYTTPTKQCQLGWCTTVAACTWWFWPSTAAITVTVGSIGQYEEWTPTEWCGDSTLRFVLAVSSSSAIPGVQASLSAIQLTRFRRFS